MMEQAEMLSGWRDGDYGFDDDRPGSRTRPFHTQVLNSRFVREIGGIFRSFVHFHQKPRRRTGIILA
jgi:hypothetical protein